MRTNTNIMMKRFSLIALTAVATACGSSSDSELGASEMAAATVSGAVNSGSGGTLALNAPARDSWERWLPISTAYAANNRCATPATAVAGLNCSVSQDGKAMTLAYNSCNFGNNSAVWEGSEILASSAAVSCGQYPSEAAGATLLRTFGEGTTRTIGNSVHVAQLDTTNPSGFEVPVSGGTFVTFKEGAGRTIQIKGVHILSQKIFRGNGNEGRVETEADHTVSTDAEQPLDVSIVNGDRVVNGTVRVQNNLAKFTGTAVFKDVSYSKTAGCCLPQSGTITTTLTGSRTGTETLTFSNTECGAAKVGDEKGGLKDIALSVCF